IRPATPAVNRAGHDLPASGALRDLLVGLGRLALWPDHHELARPYARDHPAALDLGRIGVERAFVVDGVEARGPGLVGLAAPDRTAAAASQEGREQGSR